MELLTQQPPIIIYITPQDFSDNDLKPNELFTLAGMYNVNFENYVDESLFEILQEKGFLEISRFQTKLSRKGLLLLRKLTEINSKIKLNSVKRFVRENQKESSVSDEFVKKYRSLFKGTKPGAMGSEKGVKSKLERFIRENPSATEDIIIEATRRYLNSLNSYRYVQQADYFIFKHTMGSNEETSRLSAFVDEVLANPNHTNDDEWTSNIL